MSALRQKYPKKPYDVSDDIEAFVHVILWCAIRYLVHDRLENLTLANLFWGTFECYIQSSDGSLTGCPGKWHTVKGGCPPIHLAEEHSILQDIISMLLEVCRNHYASLDLKEYKKYLPSDIKTPPNPNLATKCRIRGLQNSMLADAAHDTPTITSAKEHRTLLSDHEAVCEILYSATTETGWCVRGDMGRDNLYHTGRLLFLEKRHTQRQE